MDNLQNLQLFNDLKSVSENYSNIKVNYDMDELEINSSFKKSLGIHTSNLDELRSKVNFVHSETLNQVYNLENDKCTSVMNTLNDFSRDRFNLIKIYANTLTSPTIKMTLFSTLDELVLINNSINNRDFLNDKNSHIFLYNETLVNSFATFLALKEYMNDEDAVNGLSQGIFNQMKAVAVASKLK